MHIQMDYTFKGVSCNAFVITKFLHNCKSDNATIYLGLYETYADCTANTNNDLTGLRVNIADFSTKLLPSGTFTKMWEELEVMLYDEVLLDDQFTEGTIIT